MRQKNVNQHTPFSNDKNNEEKAARFDLFFVYLQKTIRKRKHSNGNINQSLNIKILQL